MIQTSRWEGCTAKGCSEWAGSGATGSSDGTTHPPATPVFSRGQPATLYQQAVQPPGKSSGLGVSFDSSATKPAPTGSQDADVRGRQGTQG